MSLPDVNWPRYWCPRGKSIHIDSDGFVSDPEHKYGNLMNPDLTGIEKLKDLPCLVLLGEPGIGKTHSLKELESATVKDLGKNLLLAKNLNLYDSGAMLREDVFENAIIKKWKKGNSILYLSLDSIDECLIRIDTLSSLLGEEISKLPHDRLRIRITCRTAIWPSELEAALEKIYEKNFHVYDLAPLRRTDVALAAERLSIGAKEFLDAIDKKNLSSLACKPITLEFLLNAYLEDKKLPGTSVDLYRKGCLALCENSDHRNESPKLRGKLDTKQRYTIASRIAAIAIFCGKPSIITNKETLKEGVSIIDLTGGLEMDGLSVTEEAIREVLDTGLFTLQEKGKLVFAHHTYAEFLAAEYVVNKKMSQRQIMSLLVHPESEDHKIVPQLEETAAWIANSSSKIFQLILGSDPAVILRSDVSLASDEDREKLTDVLLNALISGKESDRWGIRAFYNKLNHPTLGKQLISCIKNRKNGPFPRGAAIDIAEDNSCTDVLSLLIKIALDPKEEYFVRVQATCAIKKIGDPKTKARLKPLIFGKIGTDPDDEIKGWSLHALWPDFITIEDVVRAISVPKRTNLIGGYSSFLVGDLITNLKPNQIEPLLKWAAKQRANRRDSQFDSTINKLMCFAFNHLDDEKVLAQFTEIVAKRIKYHHDLFGTHDDEFPVTFEKDTENRRRIAKALLSKLEDPWHMNYSSPALLRKTDFQWAVSQSDDAQKPETKTEWAKVADSLFDITSLEHVDCLISSSQKNSNLYNVMKRVLEPIKLGSAEAKTLIHNYKERMKWERPSKPKPPKQNPKKIILDLLDKFEGGSMDAWWHLNRWMTVEPGSGFYGDEYQEDLTVLPGWKEANEKTKSRIVNAAKKYLQQTALVDHSWYLNNRIHFPSAAWYRAAFLIYSLEPDFIRSLPQEIWKEWVPVIVGYRTLYGYAQSNIQIELLKLAYKKEPDLFLQTLTAIMDKENKTNKDGIRITEKIVCCWDRELADVIFQQAKDNALSLSSFENLLSILLKQNYTAAKLFVSPSVKLPIPKKGLRRERILKTALNLMIHGDDSGWPVIWPVITTDVSFGKELFLWLSDREDQAKFLHRLSEQQNADLYLWLRENFPYEKDKDRGSGFHAVSSYDRVTGLRDAALQQLQHKGTKESLKQMHRIAKALPHIHWMKEALLIARKATLQLTWNPPQPQDLIAMGSNSTKFFVESETQLMDLVIDSLSNLEQELQGETPSAPNLWDEVEKNKFKPKDENSFSDEVKRHLERDLKNVIVNREVEIRRPRKGGTGGERTDVHVDAFSKIGQSEVKRITVIVEVKGCWYKGLKGKLKTQLRDRYLKDNACKCGIYLVGWFVCPQWKAGPPHLKGVSFKTKASLQKQLEEAAEKNSDDEVLIKAVVINTSLR